MGESNEDVFFRSSNELAAQGQKGFFFFLRFEAWGSFRQQCAKPLVTRVRNKTAQLLGGPSLELRGWALIYGAV